MGNSLGAKEVLQGLQEIMQGLDRKSSVLLAAGTTDWINRRMSRQTEAKCPDEIEEKVWSRCCSLLRRTDANLNSLDLGWKAYRIIYLPETQNLKSPVESPLLISSLPTDLYRQMKPVIDETEIREGSVLDNISDMISDAQELIQIINPYWSDYGIAPIIRRLNLNTNFRAQASIITRKGLEHSELAALKSLCFHFENHGISTEVKYLNCRTDHGGESLVHAKAIVVDRRKAYLGSANLTGNGMTQSVELGIIFEGLFAEKLSKWMESLSSCLTTLNLR